MSKGVGKLFGRFCDVLHEIRTASEAFSVFCFQKEELYMKFPPQEFGWRKLIEASYVVPE
jgi:hypothetical protein